MEESKQHVQVPSIPSLKEEGLNNIDPYIYALIADCKNAETGESFPSIEYLMSKSKLSKPTILNAINRLEQAHYLHIRKTFGKPNIYTFNQNKKFEIFSREFLYNDTLTAKEKAYWISTQQFMFKNPDLHTGKINYNTEVLAQKINLSVPTLMQREQSLIKKNILTIVPLEKRDNITGLEKQERIYNYDEAFNIVALKFIETDSRLENLENTKVDKADYDKLLEAVKQQQQTIEELKKELYMQKPLITGNC